MQKLDMYGFINFIMRALENNNSIVIGTPMGVVTGVPTHLDTQGPHPSVFLKHPKATSGMGVLLAHALTFGMAGPEHQPKFSAPLKEDVIPNEDGESVKVL